MYTRNICCLPLFLSFTLISSEVAKGKYGYKKKKQMPIVIKIQFDLAQEPTTHVTTHHLQLHRQHMTWTVLAWPLMYLSFCTKWFNADLLLSRNSYVIPLVTTAFESFLKFGTYRAWGVCGYWHVLVRKYITDIDIGI